IDAVGPAGSINMNIGDLADWVRFHLGDGTWQGRRLLEEATLADLHRPWMVIQPQGGLVALLRQPETPYSMYALGWMVTVYRGVPILHHGGNIDGFSAMAAFAPTEGVGVAVLANGNGSLLPVTAMWSAFDRLLDLEPIDWTARYAGLIDQIDSLTEGQDTETSEDAARVADTRPAHPLAAYVGTYAHPAYGAVEITHQPGEAKKRKRGRKKAQDPGTLHFRHNAFDGPLEHWHFETFRVGEGDVEGMKLHFRTDAAGRVEAIAVSMEPQLGEPIVFARRAPAALEDPETLARFLGTYDLPPQRAKVTLRGKRLLVHLPGQPTYVLEALERTAEGSLFQIQDLPDYRVRFESDDDEGPATRMVFIQPNGTFVAERAADDDEDDGDDPAADDARDAA
ncbi:MAG: DUF3471 domain-containing protein, partial [Acidobacteriota bacterium]